jgi:HEPN domain-containing protein
MIGEGNLKLSEDLLDDARKAKCRGHGLLNSRDYSGAVEAAQHCIELSIKAMYLLVNLNPPKTKSHDAGVELEKVVRRFNISEAHSYLMESLARMKWISTMWAWAHSESIYGCLDIPASRIFKEKDAKVALDYASEVLLNCQTILILIKSNEVKFKEVH